MESTAQCDWEGGFLQCPSNEGQRPQWEAIKPLVLNLQTTGKTSPCTDREREGKKGGDAILPRDPLWEPSQQHSVGTQINWPLPFHQSLTILSKEMSCPKHNQETFLLQQDINLFPRAYSRSIYSTALEVKQAGLRWGTKLISFPKPAQVLIF